MKLLMFLSFCERSAIRIFRTPESDNFFFPLIDMHDAYALGTNRLIMVFESFMVKRKLLSADNAEISLLSGCNFSIFANDI
jgi:hypothetical protein